MLQLRIRSSNNSLIVLKELTVNVDVTVTVTVT